MKNKATNKNSAKKTKAKGAVSLKKGVRNSKTSGKSKPSGRPGGEKQETKPAKSTISKDKTGALTPPKPLRSTNRRDILDIIGSAPKITGAFEEPYPRKRENDYAVTISVDKTKKALALDLARYYNGGQHVVAIIVPLNDVSEWPMWQNFDTGEILQAHHGSDFDRPFEVTSAFMSSVLGFTPTRLRQLENQGHAVKFGRGRWDLVGTMKKYLAFMKDEYMGRGGKEYSEERTKSTKEQRLTRELERLKLAETLVDADEYRAKAFEMGVKYRKALENLIPRVGPQLVHAKSQAKVRKILKPEIDQILSGLALNQDPKPKRKKNAGSSRKRK